MLEAGMDACRLNMSHCSHMLGRQIVGHVRSAAADREQSVAIGVDLKGPKLRVGDVVGGSVRLEPGAPLLITSEPRLSDSATLSVDYKYLASDVRPGDPVLLNDGFIVLRVEEVHGLDLACTVVTGGLLSSRKGVNLPGIPLRVPSLTEKDLEDVAFAVDAGADFLYVSYARSAEHIREVREAVRHLGHDLPIVAKIERREGVDRLQEIVGEADAICVARGDLGIEVPLGMVPWIQQAASRMCRQAGKFAMNGGQLLSSMVSNPLPLRAEVSDLATVVRDGLDAVVLSDETAIGAYPVETVRTASQIFEIAEAHELENKIREPHRRSAIDAASRIYGQRWLSAWPDRQLMDR